MKIRRTEDLFHVDLTPAEARVLLDELLHVRGGARLPKLRQVCDGLETLLELVKSSVPPPKGRRPSLKLVVTM